MESKIKIVVSVLLAIVVGLTTFLLINSFSDLPPADVDKADADQVISNEVSMKKEGEVKKRRSITFILGEDNKPENRYYWEAMNYYKTAPEARTDELVTHCRSLLEVRNYLEQYGSPDSAWGLINLVVHSNEWSGMEVPVLPEGNRATVQSIRAALNGDHFPPLSEKIVDANTRFKIHGCALGKNKTLLKILNEVFFGKEKPDSPKISSSPYFILYESRQENGLLVTRKYNAEAYYAFYKRGYRPGDIRLSRQLSVRYPDAVVDWRSALERTQPRYPGDLYHYIFHLPVVWTVTYPDRSSRPTLKSEEEKNKWLEAQPELMAKIEELGISKDLFTWTFRNIDHTFDDGITEPGIKVIGFCTVLCVIETLGEDQEPMARG